jgi:hypothetical protein
VIMTTLELVLIIILYIVVGVLSVKPILKVMVDVVITKKNIVPIAILIVLYPIFWVVVTLISVVLVVKEFYSED